MRDENETLQLTDMAVQEDSQESIIVICAWHEEDVPGSTSTICDDCMRLHFPQYAA